MQDRESAYLQERDESRNNKTVAGDMSPFKNGESEHLQSIIKGLCAVEVADRLDVFSVKKHDYFKDMDWQALATYALIGVYLIYVLYSNVFDRRMLPVAA